VSLRVQFSQQCRCLKRSLQLIPTFTGAQNEREGGVWGGREMAAEIEGTGCGR